VWRSKYWHYFLIIKKLRNGMYTKKKDKLQKVKKVAHEPRRLIQPKLIPVFVA